MADDQKPMKFRSRETDLCHRRLLRADAILVLKGKPYVHLGAANCPAAIPIRSGKKCSESGLEKTQPEPGESMSLIMIMLIIANFIEYGLWASAAESSACLIPFNPHHHQAAGAVRTVLHVRHEAQMDEIICLRSLSGKAVGLSSRQFPGTPTTWLFHLWSPTSQRASWSSRPWRRASHSLPSQGLLSLSPHHALLWSCRFRLHSLSTSWTSKTLCFCSWLVPTGTFPSVPNQLDPSSILCANVTSSLNLLSPSNSQPQWLGSLSTKLIF